LLAITWYLEVVNNYKVVNYCPSLKNCRLEKAHIDDKNGDWWKLTASYEDLLP